jgi:hypothetical protein
MHPGVRRPVVAAGITHADHVRETARNPGSPSNSARPHDARTGAAKPGETGAPARFETGSRIESQRPHKALADEISEIDDPARHASFDAPEKI